MVVIDRVFPAAGRGASGELRAGAAEMDITPHFGLPMAGYSTEGQVAEGVSGHLFARALVFLGADGQNAALCVVDLQSCSRYLLERAASITTDTCGITSDRLLLIGTHTHTGPAWFFGNSLYDTFAAREPGFDQGLADWMAERIAAAVTEAALTAEPALVGTAEEAVWGYSRNRSIAAFRSNPGYENWNRPGSPGAEPPEELKLAPEQKAVDPRMRVVAAYRQVDGSAIGAIGFFGAHFTGIGAKAEYYSPDCAGYAARKGRWDIERSGGGKDAIVALAPAAAGDVNTLRYGLSHELGPGPMLARLVGLEFGRVIGRLVRRARDHAVPVPVEVRYVEPGHGDPAPGGGPHTELASRWAFGAATLAGSEESRTILYRAKLAREPQTSDHDFPEGDPQHPKALGLDQVQVVLGELLHLDPTPVMPLHQVRLGRTLIASVPGEPTIHAARRIETMLRENTDAEEVLVVGYAGDYGGYLTTRPEFETQHYEGSSTLFGRNVTEYLTAWHRRLAEPGFKAGAKPLSRSVTFEPGLARTEFYDRSLCPRPRGLDLEVQRRGPRVDVDWEMVEGSRVVFAEGWFIRIEERVGGEWAPVSYLGRDLNDQNHVFHISRERRRFNLNPFRSREDWRATVYLPRAYWEQSPPLRVVVEPRDQFPGFTARIPPP